MRINLPADEIPTADAVALAVIAAAKVLDEDPLSLGDPNALQRFRWPAMAALNVFYPRVPWACLGPMVDVSASPRVRLNQAQGARWWKPLGETAFAAAMTALETI